MDQRRLDAARAAWRWRGQERPPWAEEPGPGQRSVWDFPRPPRIEPVAETVRVELGGVALAHSERAVAVLETASAPTVYVPPEDVRIDWMREQEGASSWCEWKGRATHWAAVLDGIERPAIAWSYPDPFAEFASIAGWLSFYPARVDGCFVGEVRAAPQPGGLYGGWVTPDLAGPIKGGPGSSGW
jgi:uncharacterized protein (DUF427 family)